MLASGRRRRENPPSELTPVRRMKLGQEEEIQFGYHSPSHFARSQDYIKITDDGLGSEAIGNVWGCCAYGAFPLRGRAEFEVKIVKSLSRPSLKLD